MTMFRDWLITCVLFSTATILGLCLLAISKPKSTLPVENCCQIEKRVKLAEPAEKTPTVSTRYLADNSKLSDLIRVYGSADDYQNSPELFHVLSHLEWYFQIQNGSLYRDPSSIFDFEFKGLVADRSDYFGRFYRSKFNQRFVVVEHHNAASVKPAPQVLIWGVQRETNDSGNWQPAGAFLYRFSDGRFMYGTNKDETRKEHWFSLDDY